MIVNLPGLGNRTVVYDWLVVDEGVPSVNGVPTGDLDLSGVALIDLTGNVLDANPELYSLLDGEPFNEFDFEDVYGNAVGRKDRLRAQFVKWATRPAAQQPTHTEAEWRALFLAGRAIARGVGIRLLDGETLGAFAARATPIVEAAVDAAVQAHFFKIGRRDRYVGRGLSG